MVFRTWHNHKNSKYAIYGTVYAARAPAPARRRRARPLLPPLARPPRRACRARLSLLVLGRVWGVWGVGGGREMRSSEDRSPDALPRKLSIVLDSHPPVSISISRGVRALRLTVSLLYLEHGLAEAEEQPLGHLAQAGREPAPG